MDIFSNLKKGGTESIDTQQPNITNNELKNVFTDKNDDDIKEKMKLIYSIQHFGSNTRFGEYLKDHGFKYDEIYLKKLSVEELKFELEKNYAAITNKNNNSFIDTGLEQFLNFIENIITNKTKYKINGTTKKLFENERFLDLLEILKLKYNIPFIKLDPIMEITLIVIQTAFMTHQMNNIVSSFKTSVDLDEEV
jgi:hypothetical protein